MPLEQEDAQAGPLEQCADCAPTGPDGIHLRLELERPLVQRWGIGWLNGRVLGLHHANPVQGNLIPVHHIDACVRVVLDQQAIAICRAIKRTGQLDEWVEVGLGVVEVQVGEAQAQAGLLKDGGLQQVAPVGWLTVFQLWPWLTLVGTNDPQQAVIGGLIRAVPHDCRDNAGRGHGVWRDFTYHFSSPSLVCIGRMLCRSR